MSSTVTKLPTSINTITEKKIEQDFYIDDHRNRQFYIPKKRAYKKSKPQLKQVGCWKLGNSGIKNFVYLIFKNTSSNDDSIYA